MLVPIFASICSKRKGLGLYKTLQEIRLVQYIFASYSNIKKVLCIFHDNRLHFLQRQVLCRTFELPYAPRVLDKHVYTSVSNYYMFSSSAANLFLIRYVYELLIM